MKKIILSILLFLVFIGLSSPAYALYISDVNGGLWDLNTSTNTSSFVGNSLIGPMFDIALDPINGNLYGIVNGYTLASISTTTGVGTAIGSTGYVINGLTFDSSGTLYGSGGVSLFTVDLGTGAATPVGNTSFTSSGDIAFDSNGNLFMSATGQNGDQLVSVNPSTGAGSLIGNIGFSDVYGLNFSGSILYGFTLNGHTIDINTSNGTGTSLAYNNINTDGADGAGGVGGSGSSGSSGSSGGVAPVPEPSTALLLCIGFLGLIWYGRNSRKYNA